MFDDLVQECEHSSEWPKNLLNSSYGRSLLCDIYNRLEYRSFTLFLPDKRAARVELMELLTGKSQYIYETWENKHQLETHFKQHLEGKEKDPLARYLFLDAAHSRAPLNCTRAMFVYICTYHHILPEFIDLVLTFGQNNVDDFSHSRFIQGDDEYGSIPELSRSDRQSRIAFKLFAMEESDYDGRWTMRQTVVYHSFDLANGRTFWLILKANGVVKERIEEVDEHRKRPPEETPTHVGDAIETALRTHVMLLNWSCEGWRWYITQLGQQARPDLVKVTAAPIPSEEDVHDPIPGLVKGLSLPRSDCTTSTGLLRQDAQRSGFMIGSTRMWKKHGEKVGVSLAPPVNLGTDTNLNGLGGLSDIMEVAGDREAAINLVSKRLNILRDFSLGGPQSLTFILSKVNEAKTAMSMNIRMSEDLRTYYQDMFESGQLDGTFIDICANAHRQFQRRARSLERQLEIECLRADALGEKIRNHINMYDMILEAENREIDKLLAISARASSERMEISSKAMYQIAKITKLETSSMHQIAKTTERYTSSMHVVTLFTLLLLPATFLGTFFSTPIFGDANEETSVGTGSLIGTEVSMNSKEASVPVPSTWSFNKPLFWLFLEICLPMMVVTITVWLVYMRYEARKTAKRGKERLERDDIDTLV